MTTQMDEATSEETIHAAHALFGELGSERVATVATAFASDDTKEGIAAFLTERTPKWSDG